MKILSIHWGNTSSAAVFSGNKIVAALSEERLSSVKNDETFPARAISSVLSQSGLAVGDLDAVAVADKRFYPQEILVHRWSKFSLQDRIQEQHDYWQPRHYEEKNPAYLDIFSGKLDTDQFPGSWSEIVRHLRGDGPQGDAPYFQAFRRAVIAAHLGVDPAKIHFVSQIESFAAYAAFSSARPRKTTAVLTLDPWRPSRNASVWKASKGKLKNLAKTDAFTAGRLYRQISLILGLKPENHAIKVMDLAPYANRRYTQGALKAFEETLHVDGLDFKAESPPPDFYFWFRDRLEGQRFDSIAGGIQEFLEELLVDWARNALEAAGTDRLALCGGLAMNTKAALRLSKLDEVASLYIPAGPGDESLSIGAAYALARTRLESSGADADENLEPMDDAFLGPAPTKKDVDSAVQKARAEGWTATENPSPEDAAALLAEGKLLGRCLGRSEFGPRALGHRSILADANRPELKSEINEKLKGRDFWVPFSPSILEERAADYFENPKSLRADSMTLAFESRSAAGQDLWNATHPLSGTIRPHVVSKDNDPDFHGLLGQFEKKTGRGGLLNTSFSVGESPLVQNPLEAFEVAKRAHLDAIAFDGVLLRKPR